jgi:hypothetical protein
MDFISAVIAIENHPDLKLCPNEDERNGVYDICVYRNSEKGGDFVGKLRWPGGVAGIADVDEAVLDALKA